MSTFVQVFVCMLLQTKMTFELAADKRSQAFCVEFKQEKEDSVDVKWVNEIHQSNHLQRAEC